jgi:3-deoxy-manno-octulosonate cytidylyltransferase (CMP-KDO synthetase)
MKTAILIPARYESKRFPGKPLCKLGDKTMIKRVYDQCVLSGHDTYVLTDDIRIGQRFGWDKCWINQDKYITNGTERCADALNWDKLNEYDQFINVQGDMPDVTQEMIEKTVWHLKHYPVTTMCAMMPEEQQNDPNTVKLVRAADKCLWFGRGIVGYGDWHLGIYGYRRNALEMYPGLISTREERLEGLEQLRWLKGGWDIGVFPCEFNGIEINTPADAERWHNDNSR